MTKFPPPVLPNGQPGLFLWPNLSGMMVHQHLLILEQVQQHACSTRAGRVVPKMA
ncbi:MAG TPA: hypothetical protein VF313_10685 [Anaerolineaceae bacterium]